MPCCGLIAFILGQPVLLWNGFRSWLGAGVPFRDAFRIEGPWSLKLAGAVVLGELILFGLGAALTLESGQIDSRLTEAAMLPIGRLCSFLSQGQV